MKRVLESLSPGSGHVALVPQPTDRLATSKHASKDETYIIDLCDTVLGRTALRQHRFSFLRGDPGKTGRRTSLPVDAFYSELNLVVEYHEQQHTQAVKIFDQKQTVSGISRGEQRRLYDERRKDILPLHGLELVIFEYSEFSHFARKRLRRTPADRSVVELKLKRFLR